MLCIILIAILPILSSINVHNELDKTTYVLSKILGFSFSGLFFSMSIPFYKKNWWAFVIFIFLGLAFFFGTTASILYPAPGENPF